MPWMTKVKVEPLFRDGNEVQCRITGDHVEDSEPPLPPNTPVVHVPLKRSVRIIFELVPGEAGTLSFHRDKPFCNQLHRCPPELPGGNENHPFKVVDRDPYDTTHITVSGEPVPAPLVNYYRLNFDDGSSCDPIIRNGGTTGPFWPIVAVGVGIAGVLAWLGWEATRPEGRDRR
jgi:hypothetical protein